MNANCECHDYDYDCDNHVTTEWKITKENRANISRHFRIPINEKRKTHRKKNLTELETESWESLPLNPRASDAFANKIFTWTELSKESLFYRAKIIQFLTRRCGGVMVVALYNFLKGNKMRKLNYEDFQCHVMTNK